MDKLHGLREKARENLEYLGQAGMALAVVHKDEVIFAEGFGLRDVEQGLKVDENTIMPIGSASKAFTATGVMMCADRGLLDIDAPLRDAMPELVFQCNVANSSVTARDILCHRTGLPRHDMLWNIRPSISRREIVETVRLLQPSAPFRTKWQYNNLMFTSAGYLVEKLTGKRWEDFTREEIFAPLGMKTANFNCEDSVIGGNFSLAYAKDLKTKALDPVAYSRVCANGPAGSINGSALEMANWIRFNLGQGTFGGKELLSKAKYSALTKPNIPYVLYPWDEPEIRIQGYGLGWFVDCFRGKTMVWHGGNVNGSSAMMGFMPELDAGVAIMVNTGGSMLTMATMYDVFDRLLGYADAKNWAETFDNAIKPMMEQAQKQREEKEKNRRSERTTHEAEEFVGTYVSKSYGTVKVEQREGKLYLKAFERLCEMENWHFDQFEVKVPKDYGNIPLDLSFVTGVSGKIEALDIPLEQTPGVDPIRFKKVKGGEERI